MVRDVFRLARENSPAIIFIDEIDAIATKRFDAQTGADREVQRILLELLNQMDGFDQGSNVKVRMGFPLQLGVNFLRVCFRLSWQQIVQIRWILHFFDQVDLTVKLNSHSLHGERSGLSSRRVQIK